MACVELRTARQRLVAFLALLGILIVLAPMPAYATMLSDPDGSGTSMVCESHQQYDGTWYGTGAGGDYAWARFAVRFKCNYSKARGALRVIGMRFKYDTGTGLTNANQSIGQIFPNDNTDPSGVNYGGCTYPYGSPTESAPSGISVTQTRTYGNGRVEGVFCTAFSNGNLTTPSAWTTVPQLRTDVNPFYAQFNSGFTQVDGREIGTSPVRTDPPSDYPVDYYSGGSAGGGDVIPATDATTGTGACDRTLTGTDAMTGSFHSSISGGAYSSLTSTDWDWGDGTTHGAVANGNHTYGALSTMPQGGWTATATYTMSLTASTTHHWSDDSSGTKTTTCVLRVDFLHPDKTAVGSNDTSSTGDSGLDSCIPSGWSVLNPFAFIGGLGCVFKKLFIPADSSIEDLGSLWDSATTKAPFSVVNDLVTYLPASLLDLRQGVRCSSPTYIQPGHAAVGCGVAPSGPTVSPICAPGTMLDPCTGNGYPFQGTALDPNDPSYSPAVSAARTAFLYVMVAVFLYACWRGAGQVLG